MSKQVYQYEYEIIRSSRKTICIKIEKNKVIVKAPKSLSHKSIEKFLQEKNDWICKHLDKINFEYEKFNDLINYQNILIFGKKYKIVRSDIKYVQIIEDKLFCPIKDTHKFIINYLMEKAKNYLLNRLNELSIIYFLPYNKFRISKAKRQWGSCSSNNDISLNFRLIMLDNKIIDYVIIHELSHTVHHDHSKDFWNLCKRILPDYKNLNNQIKEYNILNNIY